MTTIGLLQGVGKGSIVRLMLYRVFLLLLLGTSFGVTLKLSCHISTKFCSFTESSKLHLNTFCLKKSSFVEGKEENMKKDFEKMQKEMIEYQLKARKICDKRVLDAFMKVPRHEFVNHDLVDLAYVDGPLPIGSGQTISQPYIVAFMIQEAKVDEKSHILEVGAGCGYACCIMGKIAKDVYAIECVRALAELAKANIAKLEISNVTIIEGDGSLGLKEKAPFDAIIVSCGAPSVPKSLLAQLKVGGRLIIPVGDSLCQNLLVIERKQENEYVEKFLEFVRFVPMIGKEGWH